MTKQSSIKPDRRKRTLAAIEELCLREPKFAQAWSLVEHVTDRRRPADLASLARIVVEQQLSVASAAAIWARVEKAVSPFSAERLLRKTDAQLKACGLSGPKILYLRHLARAVKKGELDLALLPKLEDHAAIEMLTAVKGIGRWTAEIFLLFALDRPDIWPAHDLALQEAAKRLFGLAKRPSVREMDAMAEHWRPYRGIASRLLWRYYAVTQKRLTTDNTPP
ncbi:MAG TPA: DNA-3-methyladenine glycosylase 2 family protein [Ferrovibrio sp.]|uniref:DNA-3-methyladenine glycosylase family protein n=1 Tax=Ferrovibrio sp. TaxID=1917215 RepID=UPI002ED6B3BB